MCLRWIAISNGANFISLYLHIEIKNNKGKKVVIKI